MSAETPRGPQAGVFERVISDGGVVVFPSDTVYGLACDPTDRGAIDRLYALKGRPPAKAAAVMFFELGVAFDALPDIGPRTRTLLQTLLPGPLTVLLPNPDHRFALACGDDPGTLGLRVVAVPALAGVHVAVMQSSANPSGGADPADLSEVDPTIRDGADLVVDGGRLPGRASTVLDLRGYESDGTWSIGRVGPVSQAVVALAVAAPFRFDPGTYGDQVVNAVHDYEELQSGLVSQLLGSGPGRILELGVGTGETTKRLLEALPDARLVGVDASPAMLAAASTSLADFAGRFDFHAATLQEPLPEGEFDAVVSALTVHHLDDSEKAELFSRVRLALGSSGVFVLADVVLPAGEGLAGEGLAGEGLAGEGLAGEGLAGEGLAGEGLAGEDLAAAGRPDPVALSDGHDKPSTAADQLRWLHEAGFSAVSVAWTRGDLVVIVARV
jgi:L-threonylcarbamoyladenylate synthase